MANFRGCLGWDSSQFITLVGVAGKCLSEALVDTGGSCSIMDLALARRMGLPVTMAQSTEFGMFTTPGRLAPMAYPAAVMGPIDF